MPSLRRVLGLVPARRRQHVLRHRGEVQLGAVHRAEALAEVLVARWGSAWRGRSGACVAQQTAGLDLGLEDLGRLDWERLLRK